jgi:uroporphyrin-III C-methyltransferase/precorrin-2 dehydrogenase/sirohydrochlorin ferrochelatase
VVSGHDERSYGPVLDRLGADTALTLVVLMGVSERARLASRLLARGWDGETPAAIVLGASSAGAFAWTGTLAGLRDAPLPPDRAHLPGTLVVGKVAGLAISPARADAAPSSARAVGA